MVEVQEIIARGAESIIYKTKFFGIEAVVKERIPKGYRHPEIDFELRKARTKAEARLMHASRCAGVSVPVILDVDEFKIVMEYIPSPNLKTQIAKMNAGARDNILEELGRVIARIHSNDIVHGDLTTSNMLVYEGKLYLIDFSLGAKTRSTEAKGVDLHLLREAFLSAHAEVFEKFEIVVDSYSKHYSRAPEVIEKMREIELRGRGHAREQRGGK
ncbi:MAG: KEOPS complex kinase/ATPase Bud32 [Thermoplasmata archaeon]|nr:KEOPS complex kinase/ATPase Bud32 [Thermoplasmata archaeon]